MKKVVVLGALMALICCAFGSVAKADTCASNTNCLASGGVTFTFTSGGDDGAGGFLVIMTVSGQSGVPVSDSLTTFSLNISSGGTFGTIPLGTAGITGPSGTGNWTNE